MGQMDGKTVIVTGASSGIGRATAKLFAAEGASLVVSARRAHLLEELVAEIDREGGKAVACAGDANEEATAEAVVACAEQRFGRLDAAVHAAGILGPMAETADISRGDWDVTLATNLTSAFLAAKHQIPALRRSGGGALVFVGTFVGHTAGMPGVAAYAASKAGLIGLVQTLAVELGGEGIRVNALLPGGTLTAMADLMAGTAEMRKAVENMHALKRISDPIEQARAALFLASDAASFVTGSAMLVDGGVSIAKM